VPAEAAELPHRTCATPSFGERACGGMGSSKVEYARDFEVIPYGVLAALAYSAM
jgi:hypothetical protein